MKTHIVIGSYIFHDDKVLLIYHKKLDKWLPVGGHIDEDEIPDDAVLREIKEDVGLEAEFIHPSTLPVNGGSKRNCAIPFHVNVHSVGDHDHCCYFYALRSKGTDTTQNTKELKAMRWFSKEELKEPIVPDDVREIAYLAFEKREQT